MKQRVITAVALLALLALVVWQIYTPLFVIVIALFSAVAANEIMKCAKISNKYILVVGTAFAGLVPLFGSASVLEPWVSNTVWFEIINFVPSIVFVIVLLLTYFLAMIFGYSHTKFEDVAISFIASVVVPFGFSVFVRLRDIQGFREQLGIYLIFFGLISALGTDTGAQLGGMAFGKHKMSPHISPKKTIEGAFCGIATSIVLNALAIVLYNKFAINQLTATQVTVIMVACPFVSFMGMMGDLSASVLKRNFDVKDFGKIFPGHGGVMDRFDSSLFTLALAYCVGMFIV